METLLVYCRANRGTFSCDCGDGRVFLNKNPGGLFSAAVARHLCGLPSSAKVEFRLL